jgi:hypothetical protein
LLRASGRPSFVALANGDVVAARGVVEVLAASVFVGATAALLFAIARRFASVGGALVVVGVFAFASSAWSTGSRAFWSHTPSMLLLTVALWIVLKAEERPSVVQYLSIPLALAFCVRPTNAVAVLVFTVFVGFRYREYLLRYLLWGVPFAVALGWYHWSAFGSVLPSYYLLRPSGDGGSWFQTVAGLLVSPSRGLLVFCPWVVFASWRRWPVVWCVVGGHFLVLSLFSDYWYGGHSYGPRLFTEMMPFLALLLAGRRKTAVLAALVLFSVFVHSRGAWDADGYRWNVEPVNVDVARERLWDWSDPQFLRGI